MAKVLWQCFNCRKVSPRNTMFCPYCGGEEGSTKKKCRGLSHPPGGEEVFLTNFTLRKTGWLEGRPIPRCKKCRSLERRNAAPRDVYHPIIVWLKEQGLTQRDIARGVGTRDTTASDWALQKPKWMQKRYFIELLRLKNRVTQERRQQLIQARSGGLNSQNLGL